MELQLYFSFNGPWHWFWMSLEGWSIALPPYTPSFTALMTGEQHHLNLIQPAGDVTGGLPIITSFDVNDWSCYQSNPALMFSVTWGKVSQTNLRHQYFQPCLLTFPTDAEFTHFPCSSSNTSQLSSLWSCCHQCPDDEPSFKVTQISSSLAEQTGPTKHFYACHMRIREQLNWATHNKTLGWECSTFWHLK